MDNANSNHYLSQTEASALAGVSASTLMRFAEAGYFKVIDRNGQTQFSKQEICDVFGPAISSSSFEKGNKGDSVNAPQLPKEDLGFSNPSPLAQKVEKIITSSNETTSDYLVRSENLAQMQDIPEKRTEPETTKSSSVEAFKSVLQLQEELLMQKENRIADLIKERDWLRSRLEKMEDKSDRDQMLLMVESQKVRTLIDKATPKNNLFKVALDWLGGKPSEVQNTSNSASFNKE